MDVTDSPSQGWWEGSVLVWGGALIHLPPTPAPFPRSTHTTDEEANLFSFHLSVPFPLQAFEVWEGL